MAGHGERVLCQDTGEGNLRRDRREKALFAFCVKNMEAAEVEGHRSTVSAGKGTIRADLEDHVGFVAFCGGFCLLMLAVIIGGGRRIGCFSVRLFGIRLTQVSLQRGNLLDLFSWLYSPRGTLL